MTYAVSGLAWSQTVDQEPVPWPDDDEPDVSAETRWHRLTRARPPAALLAGCALAAATVIGLTVLHSVSSTPASDDAAQPGFEDVFPDLDGAAFTPAPTPIADVPNTAATDPDARYVALVIAGLAAAGNTQHVADAATTATFGHQVCADLQRPGVTIAGTVASLTAQYAESTPASVAVYVDDAVRVWGCGH